MPRKGSFKSSGFKSSPFRGAFTSIQNPIKQSAPTQSGPSEGIFNKFKRALAENFAWGAGNQFGHQGVRSVIGGQHSPVIVVQENAPQEVSQNQQIPECIWECNAFLECVSRKGNDISDCQSLHDVLRTCEKKYS